MSPVLAGKELNTVPAAREAGPWGLTHASHRATPCARHPCVTSCKPCPPPTVSCCSVHHCPQFTQGTEAQSQYEAGLGSESR